MWYNNTVKKPFLLLSILFLSLIPFQDGFSSVKSFRVDSIPVKGLVSYKKEGNTGGFIRTGSWTPVIISPGITKGAGEKYIIRVEKEQGLWLWKGEKSFNPDVYTSDIPFVEIEMEKRVNGERIWLIVFLIILFLGGFAFSFVLKLRKNKAALEKEIEEVKTMTLSALPYPLKIGKYKILEELGEGGFAKVYKAEDSYGDIYALKVPRKDIFADEESKKRFFREIEIGKSLHHPNIVRIFDYSEGEEAEEPYITFEFVDGELLYNKLFTPPSLSIEESLKFILSILSALEYAHERGVIHRDIKPENIIIAKNGEAKIMDFGIAKIKGQTITMTGSFLGTPVYMAPEQITAKKADKRSDLYAVGVLTYQCLTGQLPFDGREVHEVLYKVLTKTPLSPRELNPLIPRELEEIIMKLLQKDPEERFKSAKEVIEAITRIQKNS